MRPILLCFVLLYCTQLNSQTYQLFSPDRKIELVVKVGAQLDFQVKFQNQTIVDSCRVGLQLANGTQLGTRASVQKDERRNVRDTLYPLVPEKRALIPDHFNELTLRFKQSFAITFRAYNDGVAYRFSTAFKDSITIAGETAQFGFSSKSTLYYPSVGKRSDADIFHTSFEAPYKIARLDTVPAGDLAFSPVLLSPEMGPKVLLTESDLLGYPGMFLQKGTGNRLQGVFAPYPKKIMVTEGEFPQQIVTERESWIARCAGNRTYPWRVLIVAPTDADLVQNDLVYRLASPNRLKETDWIKPGTSTEEWIIGSNLYNVPFEAGINTATYKYYIDFAAHFGLEYVMLDAGWSDVKDLFKITPGMNLDTIAEYARKKNVSLILWTLSMTLDRQLDSAMQQFQRWGVRCIMTDFMDRDDQFMVNFYERIAEATARYKIMVMFHGAYKPAGMQRTYPHLITREGALGSEFNIWSETVTPDHDLLLLFIRQPSGPMDYEPGGLDNASKKTFRPIAEKVMTQGTRAHQLALFLVYESPLQMFSGNPSAAWLEPKYMELLGSFPSTWHETRVLQARLGDHLVLARRHGKRWYLAAINDWTPYETEVKLDFLPVGKIYRATICADGVNAHRFGSDYTLRESTVKAGDTMPIKLAPGGGWVMVLEE